MLAVLEVSFSPLELVYLRFFEAVDSLSCLVLVFRLVCLEPGGSCSSFTFNQFEVSRSLTFCDGTGDSRH